MKLNKVNINWNGQLKDLNLDNIDGIVFHHMVHESADVPEIHGWHLNNGWFGFAYNFWGNKKGEGFIGRGWKQGGHAKGHNATKIGVGLQGDFQASDSMTDEQVDFCVDIANHIYDVLGKEVPVYGHSDVGATSCPGQFFRMDEVKAGLEGKTVSKSKKTEPKPTTTGIIADIQSTLNSRYGLSIAVDNIYGPQTKKALVKALQIELNKQFNRRLTVDGIFGPKTRTAAVNVRKGAKGNITWILQAGIHCIGRTIGPIDGIFGPQTEEAVRSFQSSKGITVDGIAGPQTFDALFG